MAPPLTSSECAVMPTGDPAVAPSATVPPVPVGCDGATSVTLTTKLLVVECPLSSVPCTVSV